MRRRLPPLNALRAFEAAARRGGMTAAAQELGVTQGAVSRQVAALEASLGVDLFEGPPGRLGLTAAGRALAPELTAALDRMDAAVRAVAERRGGEVVVSSLETFALRWLIPRLPRFRAAHPDVEVRLVMDSQRMDPTRDGVDVAITVAKEPWPEGMLTTPLAESWIGIVLAPDLAARKPIRHAADVAGHERLIVSTNPFGWEDWRRMTGYDGPLNGASYDHIFYMVEAAAAGLGVGVVPGVLVEDELAAGRLVAPLGFAPSGRSYVALTARRPSRAAAAFVDWLGEEARAGLTARGRRGAPAPVRIVDLTAASRWRTEVANWVHAQWWSQTSKTPGDVEDWLAAQGAGGCPSAFVALHGKGAQEQAVGSVFLIASEAPDRPELTPYLGALYVAPSWRRRGVGAALIRMVEAKARALGAPALHLNASPERAPFYERRGWRVIETGYGRNGLSILRRELGGASGR
jgi:DNA-binding transcriptional LysR family regulator/GNAT superfamily N-acetyltransferase